jgi:hypothetical protein
VVIRGYAAGKPDESPEYYVSAAGCQRLRSCNTRCFSQRRTAFQRVLFHDRCW